MSEERLDFIRQIVHDDVESGKHGGRVLTRFPPEPNGFLHIGHASAICLDFEVAAEHGGRTTLRMDDTNPTTEDPAYVEAIAHDIDWLGFEWDGPIRYASDYFGALHGLAVRMIEDGFAYVDSLSEAEIREYRGSVTEPGRPSPHRERSIEENLDLFRRMRAGEFEDGSHVLRARIDMAAPNMKMRDPLMYRIRHAHHYRTGDEWPIYPMYDWAHGQSDAIEGITHSFCTLEFENNRELYDWFIEHTRPAAAGLDEVAYAEGGGGEALGSWDPRPRQYEFARRNLSYTIVSKRKLLALVDGGHVMGWDDPRMPTLAGMRRRGIPPAAIRAFCDQIGIAKADNRVSVGTLEWAIRDALNHGAPRVMCVLDPLRVVIEDFGDDPAEDFGEDVGESVDWIEAPYFPHDVDAPPERWPETRRVPFTRTVLIERADFQEEPEPGFKRLAPGREVRLRHGYLVTCREVVKDAAGEIVELRCTHDPESRGGSAPDGRKVRGTIHWVSETQSVPIEVRLYDRLFDVPDPERDGDFRDHLNDDSLDIVSGARIEPSVQGDPPDAHYQFERIGYFVRDRPSRSVAEVVGEHVATDVNRLVFNRTVSLRDSWARREEAEATGSASSAEEAAPGTEGAGEVGEVGEDSGLQEREAARAADPILAAKYERYRDELGLPEDLADLLSGSAAEAEFFEAAADESPHALAIATWLVHEVRGVTDEPVPETDLDPGALADLVALVEEGEISRKVAKDLLPRLIRGEVDPAAIVEREGLGRIDDPRKIREILARIAEAHPDETSRLREGQAALAGFFVGQVMRATENRADPSVVKDIIEESLT